MDWETALFKAQEVEAAFHVGSANPHWHCETLSREPCPTGVHQNPSAAAQALSDISSACGCEASQCRSHAPSHVGEPWVPVYCPNAVGELAARMMYVGRICTTCAQDVVYSGHAAIVTAPYGTWDGK